VAQLKVTGALGTIGQALVARYVEEGANAIVLDRPNAPGAREVVDGIGAGIRYFGCDLNDLLELERTVTDLADEVGGIDVLVNNAALVIFKHHDEFSIQEYEDQVRINSSPSSSSRRFRQCACDGRRDRQPADPSGTGRSRIVVTLTLATSARMFPSPGDDAAAHSWGASPVHLSSGTPTSA
jgi:NAD(P)-dependent dehydrogenase (short-subunit alcohol dehydrogenase family)